MATLRKPVLMATIGAAQGLRGEVRVKSYTAEPMALAEYGVLHDKAGRPLEVLDARPGKNDVVVIRFRGINERTAAEALAGTELFVERDSMPDDALDEDEYFYADLEGLEAVDAEGRSYGVVTAIFDFGGGDVLELKGEGRSSMLIPFSEAAVLEVDFLAGRMLVDPVAAGLVNTEEDGPGSRRRRPPGKPGGRP